MAEIIPAINTAGDNEVGDFIHMFMSCLFLQADRAHTEGASKVYLGGDHLEVCVLQPQSRS